LRALATEEAHSPPKLPGKLSVFPRNFSYISTRVGGFRRSASTEIDGSSRSVLPFWDRGKVGALYEALHDAKNPTRMVIKVIEMSFHSDERIFPKVKLTLARKNIKNDV